MRFRTLALIIAIVLVAGFFALNLEEFNRTSVLSLGFTTVTASLGLVMLGLLVAATVLYLASTLLMQSANLIESRKYARELNTQRELADKAEASRFTELRQYLETTAAAEKQREIVASQLLTDRLTAHERALMARLEQSENTVAAHIGQLEDRLDNNTAIRL